MFYLTLAPTLRIATLKTSVIAGSQWTMSWLCKQTPTNTHKCTYCTHRQTRSETRCENYHVNIIGHICDLRVSSYGRRDNIKIHEDREGSSSITPWTLVAGAVQALNSCLLYTRVQAGWNMRAGDMRSSQNAKLSLLPSTLYLSPSSPSTVPCNQSDA